MKLPRKHRFTLVELMVSMSIFAVLMLILMRIFGSVQDVWRKNGAKADTYESVRVAMDLIENDFMNAVYFTSNSGTHFYYNKKNSGGNAFGNGGCFWLPVKRPYESSYSEVQYTLKSAAGSFFNLDYGSISSNGFLTGSRNTSIDPDNKKGTLLENVCEFYIYPLDENGNLINGSDNKLPTYIMIKISVVDDDEAEKKRYQNDNSLKRTFRRLITIPKG